LSRNRAAYEYLPASVDGFPPPEGLQALMEDAGFVDVSVVHLTFGVVTVHRGRKAAEDG
jgi:demethylmenaquinone methyltransferase/2-methoxy-6-polyprenyl-1,4-benzoquinol methylase